MTLASDYAAAVAAAQAAEAGVSPPTPHVCPACVLSVTPTGECLIRPNGGTGDIIASADDILMMAEWITATFAP